MVKIGGDPMSVVREIAARCSEYGRWALVASVGLLCSILYLAAVFLTLAFHAVR